MLNKLIGIKVDGVGSYRIDTRKSKVQFFDRTIGNNFFKDIEYRDITQAVNRLKNVSQLMFKCPLTGYVFEIEMTYGKEAVSILMTNTVGDGSSRLLLKNEFVIDYGENWNDLFDSNGNLIGASLDNITLKDIHDLCSLSKDVINIGILYYIKINCKGEEMKARMAEIIKLVVRENKFIATIICTDETIINIENWYRSGCPMNMLPWHPGHEFSII